MDLAAPALSQLYKRSLWTQFPLFLAGAWLMAAPAMLGYDSRSLMISDIISGVLVILLTGLAVAQKGAWTSWALGAVGSWLLVAPLLFWAPTAASYTNDTVLGIMIIGFAVVIPYILPVSGPNLPPGWSYNPSSWPQRLPIIILAFINFLIAHYMSAYQLGHLNWVWDPIFADGTRRVLESQVSKAWPVSDAGLGAVTYVLDAVAGLVGDSRRWRTMPWIVVLFGIFIFPLGIVSITLIILQPVSVGAWCTLCLITALFMLFMIPFALDEVLATVQFLRRARREGQSFWKVFWLGGTISEEVAGYEPTGPVTPGQLGQSFKILIGPWNLMLTVALGIWLMMTPAFLGISGTGADYHYISGALVITFSIIAFVEMARPVRFVNILLTIWIIIAPWIFSGIQGAGQGNGVLVGLAIIVLSIRRGPVKERFADWNRYLV